MSLIDLLIKYRSLRIAKEWLAFWCVELPAQVKIGRDFQLAHRGFGTVIHPDTTIGDRVKIFHQVTIGRADSYRPREESLMRSIVIGDDVIIFPGAKVLGGPGITVVGCGTIIAANAVLTKSTGEYEIWGGIPARKISDRTDLRPEEKSF